MRNKKRWLIGGIGILISVIAVVLLVNKVDFRSSFKTLADVPVYYFIILMAIYLSTFWLRALRWQLMLRPLSHADYKEYLDSLVLGFFGNNIIPARGGEVLRMFYFNYKTGMSKVTSLSSIMIEKILDGLTLVFILLIAVFWQRSLISHDWVQHLIVLSCCVFIGAIVTLVGIKHYHRKLQSILAIRPEKIVSKFATILSKFHDALQFLKGDLNSVSVLLLGIIIWIVEGAMFVLGLQAIGIAGDDILVGYFTLAIVNFGLLVPSSPGYIGVFQTMMILALMLFGITESKALSCGILVHMCQFIPITIWGAGIFFYNSLSFNYEKISGSNN